jgi:glucokinase
LSERLAVPVALGHDAKMAGEAEFRLGAARGCINAIVMVIGTGISGVIFSDGRRVSGGSYAGELGHALVPGPDGSMQRLECIGAAGAIARRYVEATGSAADGARGVLRMAQNGDTAARRIWSEAVDAIAFNIAQAADIPAPAADRSGGHGAERWTGRLRAERPGAPGKRTCKAVTGYDPHQREAGRHRQRIPPP